MGVMSSRAASAGDGTNNHLRLSARSVHSATADSKPSSEQDSTEIVETSKPDLCPSSESLLHESGISCGAACSETLRQFFRARERRPNSEERELLSSGTHIVDSSPNRSTAHANMTSMPEQTPFLLHTAVTRKDVAVIRKIIRTYPGSTTELNLNGESALHIACKNGDIDIVDEMLNLGCDPNICTGVGIPVHSVLQGMKEGQISEELGIRLLQLFLQKGCDLTLSNAEDQNSKTVLLSAAEYGSPACMDILIRAGASVNTMDHNCFSPLYMSAIRGDLACVKLLLQHKSINVNVQDTSGRTPLIASLITIISSLTYDRLNNDLYNMDCVPDEMIVLNRNNRIAIMESLLAAGADPNIVDRQGRNALGLAFLMLELEDKKNSDDTNLPDPSSPYPFSYYESSQMPNSGHESMYALLVRLLVMYGAVLPSHMNMNYFSKARDTVVRLFKEVRMIIENKLVEKPSRLTHICRMKIRSHLADLKNLDKIKLLPLPQKLKRYIQFEYF